MGSDCIFERACPLLKKKKKMLKQQQLILLGEGIGTQGKLCLSLKGPN